MQDNQARSAMDELRRLAEQIDAVVETALEAHGFAFEKIEADGEQVGAIFRQADEHGGAAWRLVLSQSSGGTTRVHLTQQEKEPDTALQLIVPCDEKGDRPMAACVGLALSLISLCDAPFRLEGRK
jgi:class 3 adenylate cyclase